MQNSKEEKGDFNVCKVNGHMSPRDLYVHSKMNAFSTLGVNLYFAITGVYNTIDQNHFMFTYNYFRGSRVST